MRVPSVNSVNSGRDSFVGSTPLSVCVPSGIQFVVCLCVCVFGFRFPLFPFLVPWCALCVEFVGVQFSCSDLFFDVSEVVPSKEFICLLTRLKI